MKKRGDKRTKMEVDDDVKTLDAVRESLPAAKRSALDAELERIKRRFAYAGAKRGPRPKLGSTMNDRVVVKVPTSLRREIEGAARGLGYGNGADYLRELHRRHVAAGGKVIA